MRDTFTRWWNDFVEPTPPPVAAGEPLYPSRAIYIAARYSRKEEADTLALDLELSGHVVVSSWHRPDSRSPTWRERRIAEQDMFDLLEADTLISLAEEPRTPTRGGRLVEFGVALGLGKRIIVYGDGEGLYETVFHSLPEVEQCPAQLWVLLHTLTRPGPAEEAPSEHDLSAHGPAEETSSEHDLSAHGVPFEYGWHHGTEHWDARPDDVGSVEHRDASGLGTWEAIWDISPTEVPGPEGSR